MDRVKRISKRALTSLGLTAGLVLILGAGVAFAEARWAVVDSDGTLARGKNVTNVIHHSTGLYEVEFAKKDITGCAYVATVGTTGVGSTDGFATVAGRAGNAAAVLVVTSDRNGTVADRPFHLKVFC